MINIYVQVYFNSEERVCAPSEALSNHVILLMVVMKATKSRDVLQRLLRVGM